MTENLICIDCPLGCSLEVICDKDKIIELKGSSCKRGEEYAEKEIFHPERIVTTTVSIKLALVPLVPVRTERSIPRNLAFKVIECASTLQLEAPVKVGDIVIENILGTGVNLVVTRNLDRIG